MENAYAQALWNIIEKGTKPADAVRAMHEKLQSEGRGALWPRISLAFQRLAARDRDRNAITISIADAAHEQVAVNNAEVSASEFGIEVKDAEVRIDPTLIGGWRLEGHEHLIDASHKKHLLAIYRAATRS